MLNTQLVRDRFGQRYKIHTPKDKPAPKALKPELFYNTLQAERFVNSLITSTGYWSSLLSAASLTRKPPQNRIQILQGIAALITQGKLIIYKVELSSHTDHPPAKRTLLDSNKNRHIFMPASSLLISSPKEVKTFTSEKEATTFLTGIAPDEEKIMALSHELGLKPASGPHKNKQDTSSKLSAALASGSIVIIVDRYTTPPRPAESFADIINDVGHRKADLGPPPDEYKEINIDLEDEFEKNLGTHFSLFNGLKYTLKTDMGDEQEGTIADGKIYIPKAKMSSGFELTITDMPAFIDM